MSVKLRPIGPNPHRISPGDPYRSKALWSEPELPAPPDGSVWEGALRPSTFDLDDQMARSLNRAIGCGRGPFSTGIVAVNSHVPRSGYLRHFGPEETVGLPDAAGRIELHRPGQMFCGARGLQPGGAGASDRLYAEAWVERRSESRSGDGPTGSPWCPACRRAVEQLGFVEDKRFTAVLGEAMYGRPRFGRAPRSARAWQHRVAVHIALGTAIRYARSGTDPLLAFTWAAENRLRLPKGSTLETFHPAPAVEAWGDVRTLLDPMRPLPALDEPQLRQVEAAMNVYHLAVERAAAAALAYPPDAKAEIVYPPPPPVELPDWMNVCGQTAELCIRVFGFWCIHDQLLFAPQPSPLATLPDRP